MNLAAITTIKRQGVTLIEVIFSMGVILIGLLGLMSILPLAGHRARDAVSLNTSAAVSQTAFTELLTRRYFSKGLLAHYPPGGGEPTETVVPGTTFSYCIDPIFANASPVPVVPPDPRTLNYSPGYFPYYFLDHDLTTDPMGTATSAPRPSMLRVGITDTVGTPLTSIEARARVENPDDVIVTQPTDRALPSRFSPNEGELDVGAGLGYGARIPSGEYSWIATVNPIPGSPGFANVAVIVRHNRERYFAPLFDPSYSPPSPVTPSDNATAERISIVNLATSSGFRGGAGGTVELTSSAATVASIRSGDWIMLSQFVGGDPLHRWYRVAAASGDSTSDATWPQRVLLDGPDWDLSLPTAATILKDVVSVTERVVLLSEL